MLHHQRSRSLTTARRYLRRVGAVHPVAWPVLCRLIAMALGIEIGMRARGVQRFAAAIGVAVVHDRGVAQSAVPRLTPSEHRAIRLTLKLMRHWPWGEGSCLRQSLLLGWLLRSRSPVVRLGVRHRDGALQAHAWLDVGGLTIGEVGDFVQIGEAQPVPSTPPNR